MENISSNIIIKKIIYLTFVSIFIFSCKRNKKNFDTGLSDIGNVYLKVKFSDIDNNNIKGVIEYFNTLDDTLLIDNPKDDRYLMSYIYLSEDFVSYKEFPEQLSDTFVAYSKRIRDTLKLNFSIKRKKGLKGNYNLKIKVLDQIFLNSYDSIKVRYIKLPFFYDKRLFFR